MGSVFQQLRSEVTAQEPCFTNICEPLYTVFVPISCVYKLSYLPLSFGFSAGVSANISCVTICISGDKIRSWDLLISRNLRIYWVRCVIYVWMFEMISFISKISFLYDFLESWCSKSLILWECILFYFIIFFYYNVLLLVYYGQSYDSWTNDMINISFCHICFEKINCQQLKICHLKIAVNIEIFWIHKNFSL